MIGVAEAVELLRSPGLGFERVEAVHGSTYRDTSSIVVVPTRGMVHHRVVSAWQGLITPMNQRRAFLFAAGHEVGHAYNELISRILAEKSLSGFKYLLTLEDDNLPPPDAHIRLIESIEEGKFDAVSGIYFTKGDLNMPQAYGDPAEYERTGALDFRPRDTRDALRLGHIMPVCGIAMGCALWRLDLFRRIPPPWFVTCADVVPEGGVKCMTQDLYFCERAVRSGARFAVDMRVKVGHLDVNTGEVY